MPIKQLGIILFNGGRGVQDLGEVERYPDMNVGQCGSVSSDVFEEQFWFCKVVALHIDEFRIRVWKCLPLVHFEEAAEDDEEFLEID
jgi:hypothetical protein